MASGRKTLKLGTRRSLLALAQSGWVAREVERLNPGIKVELVGMDTQGDRIQDVPLSKIEGKEFFVAELDRALESGAVDFCVHFLKDLSLQRPAAFAPLFIPSRENPRDAIVFSPRVIERLAAGETLRIGTSAPRRLENLPAFLSRALPRVAGASVPQVEFTEIRGNVNTRLSRVHERGERYLDGVVLAAAGLNRMFLSQEARAETVRLLAGTRLMLVPLTASPGSPGQGALAVECRAGDEATRRALTALHCEATAAAVKMERQVLADWGGGCHLKLGATAFAVPHMGTLMLVRGRKPSGEEVNSVQWPRPVAQSGSAATAFSTADHRVVTEETIEGTAIPSQPLWILGHSRALPEAWLRAAAEKRIYLPGTASWFRLAEKGLWVEGCSEGQGTEALLAQLHGGLLRAQPQDCVYLTHEGASATEGMATVATYRLKTQLPSAELKALLARSRFFYWTSFSQYEALRDFLPRNEPLHHACGPGKTGVLLRSHGMAPLVFPNPEEWRKWLT